MRIIEKTIKVPQKAFQIELTRNEAESIAHWIRSHSANYNVRTDQFEFSNVDIVTKHASAFCVALLNKLKDNP